MRSLAGIPTIEWSYNQSAVAASFAHSLPHRDTSIEMHRQAGPLTTVPMRDGRSSLVWMDRPDRAKALVAMTETDFARALQAELHGELGLVSQTGPRRAFPMRGLAATAFARNRVFLLGEAAHAIPPVGAQGLNLSLRDAATAAEVISGALASGTDPGSRAAMADYDRRRRRDVAPRIGVVDLVNRSLLSGFALPHVARALGLALASGLAPVRQAVLRHGVGLGEDLPAAMRG